MLICVLTNFDKKLKYDDYILNILGENKVTKEELLDKLNFIQKMKCESQVLELKSAQKRLSKVFI